MRWTSRWLVVVGWVAWVGPATTVARAQPAEEGSAPADAPKPPDVVRGQPALVAVAYAIEASLASVTDRALVVAAPLESDVKAKKPDALTAAIAAQVSGRRGASWSASAEPAPLPAAREMARKHRRLVHLRVEIRDGLLRVTADVYPVPGTVWSRIRDPEPGPVAHAYAQAPIDAEVRAYLEPVPIAALDVVRAQNFESDVLALACGDVDLDGAPEILSVSRRRVTLLRLREGKVLPIRSRPWSELSPVHPTPLREPLGFATVVAAPVGRADGAASLYAATTDRARAVRLDAELGVVESFGRLAIPDGDAVKCAGLIDLAVTGPVAACSPDHPAPLTPTVGGRYDAFASARLVTPAGKPFVVWVGREDGVVEVREDGGGGAGLGAAGAQLAVGDLDQDGVIEVLSSLDVLDPLKDAVLVRKVSGAGKGGVEEVSRLPAGAGVRALAVCPPTGAGRAPFVVATSDQIWVVR